MTQPTGTLIDLSQTIEDGLVTYKGLPAPIVCDFLTREASRSHYSGGTEFHIGKIEMVANTGTYLDAPFHRWADGIDIADLPLTAVADLPAIHIDTTSNTQRAIGPEWFEDLDIAGKAVLVQTGWDKHWNTEQYYEGHPYLTEETAVFLKQAGVRLVGIDSYNIDSTDDGRRPVHSVLLRHNILIVEHMTNLRQLPANGFRFYAVPVKVKGMGTFPVRAFALVNN
ncbi:MAG: cyclase family protein [Anaerolineae bacterium]|nr:cyclase family protein [Anaerolineae bacterium]